jgi:glycosyltransferase involved in cell wall biosynthesis
VHVFLTIAGIDPESGGPSRCVPSLAHGLAHQGIDVSLLTLCSDRNVLKSKETYEYALYGFEFKGSGISKLKAVERLRQDLCIQVREFAGHSIIHDNGIWLLSNHAAVSVARKTRTPSVVSTHGMLSPWAINHKALKKKIAWQLYLKRDLCAVDLIHATSQQEAECIFESGLHKPVAIVPNGVDVPPWRERTATGIDKKTILFLSRIYPVKGLLNLVNAWQQIKASDWRIVVAGHDEAGHQKEVMAAVHAAGLQDWFEFVGPVGDNDKWNRFFNADLFVLPSFSENFGIVVAEALACGVPVITTTGTPWQELITHKCGWWVDVGVQPLVDALVNAISLSDSERSAMGIRGRQLVESSYGWDKIASEMLSVYEWILRGGSPPPCVRID